MDQLMTIANQIYVVNQWVPDNIVITCKSNQWFRVDVEKRPPKFAGCFPISQWQKTPNRVYFVTRNNDPHGLVTQTAAINFHLRRLNINYSGKGIANCSVNSTLLTRR
uniref:Uncharacterized protein n=1 Tax=Romanomermis culicivorax TaxID=13658 RepID=A0A915HJU5_ROMCU